MNNFCTIYLVRHGRTDWNDLKLIQGHIDILLNLEGQTSAQELARELKKIKFDKIYSSDLLRAKETAQIIALEHKLKVETTEALRERNYGPFQGEPRERLAEIDRILETLTDGQRYSYTHNGVVESDKEMMTRFMAFIKELAVAHPGKTILVATHGGVIRTFLTHLGILDYAGKKGRFEIKNLAFVKLESDGIDFFVKEASGIEKHEFML
jgi:broad specificity phosphatase PhoE